MPCYGETVCILCQIGISESEEDARNPGIYVSPSRERLNKSVALPEWIYSGAVYIGASEPVFNLTRHPEGLMGWWVDSNDNNYGYDHVHTRCYKVAEKREKDILKVTGAKTLCEGLMRLITAFGGHICTVDKSYCCQSPDLDVNHVDIGCYNVISHSSVYYVKPFHLYRKYMGQACNYNELLKDGLTLPTDSDVDHLLKVMLTARDWAKLPISSSMDCIYCTEYRTKEETDLIDKKHPDWVIHQKIGDLEKEIGKKLGYEEMCTPFDDYESENFWELNDKWKKIGEIQRKKIHGLEEYKIKKKQYEEEEVVYQKELDIARKKAEARRRKKWLELVEKAKNGQNIKAQDIEPS